MSAATTKAPKPPRLTLEDFLELQRAFEQYVDDNIEQIAEDGGALEDWAAKMFDEIYGGMQAKADAIAAVVDAWKAKLEIAKTAKQRADRRRSVIESVLERVKSRAVRDLLVFETPRLEGTACVIRAQRNSAPSSDLTAPKDAHNDILVSQFDTGGELARFVTIDRVAKLDRDALGKAYEARAEQLAAEATLLVFDDDIEMSMAFAHGQDPDPEPIRASLREKHVRDALAREFPGVSCVRSFHLRID